jgi:predicted DNA-binding transcriptional regulator AlpA
MERDLKEQLSRIERNSLLAAKNVLGLDDVALLTGLSKSWLYKATCSHTIPHYKQAKLLWFDRAEIENWQKQNKIATTGEIDRQATSYVTTGKKGGNR